MAATSNKSAIRVTGTPDQHQFAKTMTETLATRSLELKERPDDQLKILRKVVGPAADEYYSAALEEKVSPQLKRSFAFAIDKIAADYVNKQINPQPALKKYYAAMHPDVVNRAWVKALMKHDQN